MNRFSHILVCLLLTFPWQVFSCERTLSVASHDAFWPPYVMGMSHTFKGAEVDALNIIFKDSPFCFKVELLPNSKRAFTEIRHGRIDLGWAASYTKDRAKYVHYTDSYRTEVMSVYENKNNSHSITSLADIFEQGLSVVANFGSYYGDEFELYKTRYKKQIEYTSATSKRFEMLSKQRIDFAIEDTLVGDYFSQQSTYLQRVNTVNNINKNQVHLMLSKKTVSQAEVNIINKYIAKNNAALKALFKEL